MGVSHKEINRGRGEAEVKNWESATVGEREYNSNS